MPLAFSSISHGTIAFGFFNIESDMLLCDHCFFFATDFCRIIENLVEHVGGESYQTPWQVYLIERPEDIGDLSGAIQGNRFEGFIGELYRSFPFPENLAGFKQNPKGSQTQSEVLKMIEKYARLEEISVEISAKGREINIGAYRFTRNQFQKLVLYVWRGGYPRWKDEIRPAYVTQMKDSILLNCKGIFEGIIFEG
jgi:hypothetical protein